MRLLILAALLAAPSSAAQPGPAQSGAGAAGSIVMSDGVANALRAPRADCKRPDVHQADTPLDAEHRKLGELPPGDTILAVYNEVDGCMEPVIVRYGQPRAPMPVQVEPVRPRARVFR